MPTRLIKIDGHRKVRLHVATGTIAPYLCLSHCWGTNPIVKTTLSTLAPYQAGIAWEKLPKTFQQAIDFTYRLGYAYIWIDSLCIIQDSDDDWRYEASRMASIYENASVTLCASKSADSSGGCYAITPSKYQSKRWSFKDNDSNTFEVHTRPRLEHNGVTFHDTSSSRKLPLLSRGWALQERFLSPRTVHFTELELVWDCAGQLQCECSEIHMDTLLSHKPSKAQVRLHEWPQIPLDHMQSNWESVVQTYSSMELSFTKDIFPALQGLAQRVPSKMGKYLAGLWSETLTVGLIWSRTLRRAMTPWAKSKSIRPSEWRAPTWSWASITESVKWRYADSPYYADGTTTRVVIIKAATEPIGDDATGALSYAELILRGRSVRAQVVYPTSEPVSKAFETTSKEPSLVFRDQDTQQELKIVAENPCRFVIWDYAIDVPGPDHVADGSRVLIVRILDFSYQSDKRPKKGDSEEDSEEERQAKRDHRSFWLVLRHGKRRSDAYERIGLVVLLEEANKRDPYWPLKDAYENSLETEFRVV
jgi:hypothetical protein